MWWIVLAVLLAVILILVLISRYRAGQLGVYGTTIVGPCIVESGNCKDDGLQTTIQICHPNPTTGRGCKDKDGYQTFDTIVTRTKCNIQCVGSVWQEAITSGCTVIGNTTCVISPNQGQRTRRKTCVRTQNFNQNSLNNCVLSVVINGVPTLKEFQPDEFVESVESCANHNLPTCGTWQYRNPVTPIDNTITAIGLSGTSVSTCVFASGFEPANDCIVKLNSQSDLDTLAEGYFYYPMVCSHTTYGELPGLGAPAVTDCQGISCIAQMFSPQDIQEQKADYLVNNSVICSGSQSNQLNPTCLVPCRYVPDQVNISPELDPLLNNFVQLLLPDGYLAGYQVPSNSTELVKLSNSNPDVSLKLIDTPLMQMPNSYVRQECTLAQTVQSTGAYIWFGPRRVISSTSVEVIILVIINGIQGWLTTKQGLGYWTQTRQTYNGPGTTAEDAQHFILTLINNSTVNITQTDNSSISITSYNNEIHTLNGLTFNLYSRTSNLGSAINNICNWYLANK